MYVTNEIYAKALTISNLTGLSLDSSVLSLLSPLNAINLKIPVGLALNSSLQTLITNIGSGLALDISSQKASRTSSTTSSSLYNVGTTAMTILSSNVNRRGFIIVNMGGVSPLYIGFGFTPTQFIYSVAIPATNPYTSYELTNISYQGIATAIRATGAATLICVTEFV